jgi:hypothetical protein
VFPVVNPTSNSGVSHSFSVQDQAKIGAAQHEASATLTKLVETDRFDARAINSAARSMRSVGIQVSRLGQLTLKAVYNVAARVSDASGSLREINKDGYAKGSQERLENRANSEISKLENRIRNLEAEAGIDSPQATQLKEQLTELKHAVNNPFNSNKDTGAAIRGLYDANKSALTQLKALAEGDSVKLDQLSTLEQSDFVSRAAFRSDFGLRSAAHHTVKGVLTGIKAIADVTFKASVWGSESLRSTKYQSAQGLVNQISLGLKSEINSAKQALTAIQTLDSRHDDITNDFLNLLKSKSDEANSLINNLKPSGDPGTEQYGKALYKNIKNNPESIKQLNQLISEVRNFNDQALGLGKAVLEDPSTPTGLDRFDDWNDSSDWLKS